MEKFLRQINLHRELYPFILLAGAFLLTRIPIVQYTTPVLFPFALIVIVSRVWLKVRLVSLLPLVVLGILLMLQSLPYINLLLSNQLVFSITALVAVLVYPLSSGFFFSVSLASLALLLVSALMKQESSYAILGEIIYASTIIGVFKAIFPVVTYKKLQFSLPKFAFFRKKNMLSYVVLVSLLAITFYLRFVLAQNFYGTLDTSVHIDLVNLYLQGKNVYIDGNYAYPPLWLMVLVFLRHVSEGFDLSNLVLLKLPAILADCGISMIIFFHFIKRTSLKKTIGWVLLFALNPIAILVSGYHGQIDTVWLFFSLWAWYIFSHYKNTLKQTVISSLILSLGIALKVFPLVFVPLFLMKMKSNKQRIIFTVLSISPLAISMIGPFLTSYHQVMNNFVNYGIELDFWGISALSGWLFLLFPNDRMIYIIFRVLRMAQLDRLPLYASLLISYIYLYKQRGKFSLEQGMFFVILVMLIMTPFISIQWWVWLVPVAIIAHENIKKYLLYTIFMSYVLLVRYYLYMANNPPEYQLFIPQPIWHGIALDVVNRYLAFGVWIMLCVWLVENIKKINHNKNTPKV